MTEIPPFVRHLLLCDDVKPNQDNLHRVNIFGLLSVIRGQDEPTPFPLHHTFSVYTSVSGGRGQGKLQLIVMHADSATRIYESPQYQLIFDNDPLKVQGIVIRVHTCTFPESGLYWVEL